MNSSADRETYRLDRKIKFISFLLFGYLTVDKAMLNPIKNKLAMVALSFFVTACAHIGYEKKDLAVLPTTAIVAFNEAQVNEVINNATWLSDPKVGETSLSDVPLLNSMKTLSGLDDYRPHRAFAIGYPNECGGSWHSWNYSSEALAAKAALSNCLEYIISGREKHIGKECGVRLVMVNKRLLVRPEELPDQFREPFVYEMKSPKGEEVIIYGMFQYQGPGKNLPCIVFNEKGEKICDGRYSLSILQAFLGSGEFNAQCFGNQLPDQLQGSLSMKIVKLPKKAKRVVTTVKGRASDGSEYKVLVGIAISDYENYKYLLK